MRKVIFNEFSIWIKSCIIARYGTTDFWLPELIQIRYKEELLYNVDLLHQRLKAYISYVTLISFTFYKNIICKWKIIIVISFSQFLVPKYPTLWSFSIFNVILMLNMQSNDSVFIYKSISIKHHCPLITPQTCFKNRLDRVNRTIILYYFYSFNRLNHRSPTHKVDGRHNHIIINVK